MKVIKSVSNLNALPVLAQPGYLLSLNGVYDYGYFTDNEMILPFVIRKKLIFKWIQLDNVVYGAHSIEETIAFLDDMVRYVSRHMSVSHIVSTNTAIFDAHPTQSYYCKFGTYLVDLSLSGDVLFQNLHSKHRNVIRKAQSDGIVIEHGPEHAAEAIALMQETFSRQNKVSGIEDSLAKKLQPLGDNVDYWVAKDSEGHLQGSAIFLWNKGNSCYYMHGGSTAHTRPGSMNLLMWEAMKCMKDRGVSTFDFVGARLTTESGSKLEGIQRFKSRFGAEMKVGYMFRVVIDKYAYALYKTAMDIAYLILSRKLPKDVIKEERKKGNM